jgi:hypothetical protein
LICRNILSKRINIKVLKGRATMKRQIINISATILGILVGFFVNLPVSAQTATHRTPLDFDGDGKTDIVVARSIIDIFERLPFEWWIYGSASNQMMPVVTFGAAINPGHIPIPADYDGDGKTDIAVFLRGVAGGGKGNQSFFYVLRSSDGRVDWIKWGLDSDDPYMTQDFDGDGKADPTVVRCGIPVPGQPTIILENRTWYILESRNNYQSYRVETFGKCDASRDRSIRGDFDGDGKADLAFYRQLDVNANGQTTPANRFYMKLSGRRNIVRKIRFDYAENGRVIQGDFDGDGRTDIASVRSEVSGDFRYRWWYWLRSSDGQFVAKQFGASHPSFDQQDSVVPGDYDGDGKTDTAIFRAFGLGPRQTYFYIDGSRDGFKVVPWGLELSDLPVAQYIYVR